MHVSGGFSWWEGHQLRVTHALSGIMVPLALSCFGTAQILVSVPLALNLRRI